MQLTFDFANRPTPRASRARRGLACVAQHMAMAVMAATTLVIAAAPPAAAEADPWRLAADATGERRPRLRAEAPTLHPWARLGARPDGSAFAENATPWTVAVEGGAPIATGPALRGPLSLLIAAVKTPSLPRSLAIAMGRGAAEAANAVAALSPARRTTLDIETETIPADASPEAPREPLAEPPAPNFDWAAADAPEIGPNPAEPTGWATEIPADPEPSTWTRLRDALDPVDLVLGDPFAAPADPSPVAAAPPAGETYSLAELTQLVLSTNEDVLIARERAEAARIAFELARRGDSPSVDLEIVSEASREKPFWDKHQDTVRTQVAVTASQTLYDFGRTAADVDRARQAHLQAQAESRTAAEDAVSKILEALTAVARAAAILEASERNIESLKRILGLVRLSEEQGAATQADVRRVSSRLDAALSSQIQLKSQRETAANSFARLAGLAPEAVSPDALARLAVRAGALEPAMLDGNPDLESLARQLASLEDQYRATTRGRLPTLDLEAGGGYSVAQEASNSESLTGSISLLFSMKLYDDGKNALERERVLSQIREARLRLAKERRRIEEEARNSTQFGRTDDDKTRVLRDRVESLERVAELYVEQFAGGQRTVFELLESEADLLSARIDETSHRFERMSTAFRQLRLSGRLTAAALAVE